MDRIVLTGIEAVGYHGVEPHERQVGQVFTVDVVLEVSLAAAAASDDLADTISYADVADEIAALIAGEPHQLIETLAAAIADTCLSNPRVRAVDVTVHKPNAPINARVADVAVQLSRSRGAA